MLRDATPTSLPLPLATAAGEGPPQWFHIVFELAEGGARAYERVYAAVHAANGYHYRRDALGQWQRLPQHMVAVPLPVADPRVARIAFELLLAQLDEFAAAIFVFAGDYDGEWRPVLAEHVPAYAIEPVVVHSPRMTYAAPPLGYS